MSEDLLDRWGRRMRGWVETAEKRTEEVARVSRCQVELLQIQWDLFRRRAALAQSVTRLFDRGELPGLTGDPEAASALASVRSLEREEREKKREIEEIRGRADEKEEGPEGS